MAVLFRDYGFMLGMTCLVSFFAYLMRSQGQNQSGVKAVQWCFGISVYLAQLPSL